jgi:tryptophan halogenase
MLRDRVAIPKGVTHILDDISEVKFDDKGVSSILGKKSTYTADFYIDCTGFNSMLRKPMGIIYKEHKNLINNYAVAGPGDFALPATNYTQTYAMDHGWRWRISLQHRTGNGYAFNKDLVSIDQAIDEFIRKTPGLKKEKIFHVPFKSGFITDPWKKNVITIGLSSGFLEPLESTGIFLIHGPLKLMVKLLNDSHGAEKFNRVWTKMYNHLGEYISLHYRTSQQSHTEYWRSIPKIDRIKLPEPGQILFDQYSHRQLANGRGIDFE